MDFEPWIYVLITAGAVATVSFMLYATMAKRKGKEPPEKVPLEAREKWLPLKTERTITSEEAKKAQEELKLLDLEREILSYGIRRLYEAQAEGKITEEEREGIAHLYKARMMKIRDTISRSESIVALHELETMQEDLIKLFTERFDELSKKVEEVRTRLEVRPVAEVPISTAPTPTPTAPSEKERKKVRKKAPPSRKTEAEKRIEEIKAEVEKVLERLGQIEVEA